MPISIIVILLILLFFSGMVLADTVVIDDFKTIDAWSLNSDGGMIGFSKSVITTPDGKPSMRLSFPHKGYEWGTAARVVSLPPNAVSIDFDLYVERTSTRADIFIWLIEEDGDGHLAHVKNDGKLLSEWKPGWRHCRVPISSFTFDPRGNKVRELLTTNKMLLGLCNGEATVSIANLAFTTVKRGDHVKLNRTVNLKIEDEAKGRIAILRDEFPKRPGNADPQTLADELRKGGYGVTFLKSGDMSDPSVLTIANFGCIVFPYGPRYPLGANDAIKKYLKSGGSFLSTGGYAYDEPCALDESGKMSEASLTITAQDAASSASTVMSLNTRFGKPGDTMGIDPEQIGVFDPGYKIVSAHDVKSIYGGSVQGKDLNGYSTCAILGDNDPVFPIKWGKWVPILQAYDEYSRPMGSFGAFAFNYAGTYAGSSWAFFGVTDRDLFAKDGLMLPQLNQVMERLLDKTFIHSLNTDLFCYKADEKVKLSCIAANLGKRDKKVSVEFVVYRRDGKEAFRSRPIPVNLKAGQTETVGAEFNLTPPLSDFYRVAARLSVDGKTVDLADTGFVVYDKKTIDGGFHLRYKDNFFHDGERPVLLSGTNVTGAIFCSGNENPLVWDRDIQGMQENGLNTLRVLHYSPFIADNPSPSSTPASALPSDKLPIKLERQTDALVQLCQKHKVILFLDIHDWQGVELSDADLKAQQKFAHLIADRYKDVPGIMIDIQNEPSLSVPDDGGAMLPADILKSWNDYLREKYKTDETLKASWTKSPPEAPIGSIPWKNGKDEWDDMRTFDADNFRNVLVNRWIDANSKGAKEGDPDMPVTVGYLQEYWALNKILCMEGLDFASMHSYTTIDVLRADMKLFDRRFEGKSLSMGEFGSVADHEKRNQGITSDSQDTNRYLLTGHYCFGEGGSAIANWCWKDMDDVFFPWGVKYPCDGPSKDLLKAFRNQSLLFRQVKPVYKSPEVFLVIPVLQMLGGQSSGAVQTLYSVVNSMLGINGDFGAIDDAHLSKLPSSAKVLVYPTPANIPDDAYARLKAFVENGGTLCITGDVSFDQFRRRTRTDRLEELCGVKSEDQKTWTPTTATGDMNGFHNKMGKGKVLFIPNQTGLTDSGAFFFKDTIGKSKAEFPDTHAFTLHESGGYYTRVFVNPATSECGMLRYRNTGQLLTAESSRSVKREGRPTIEIKGHFAVISCDGKDITESQELIVLPFGVGELDLGFVKGDVVVQMGEVSDGKWKPFSDSRVKKIVTGKHDAFEIRIVAPNDHLKSLGEHVVSEMMLKK